MLFFGATLSSIYKLKLILKPAILPKFTHSQLYIQNKQFILKPAILPKFTHSQLYIQNKQLRLLLVLALPHILTVIYVFKKGFY